MSEPLGSEGAPPRLHVHQEPARAASEREAAAHRPDSFVPAVGTRGEPGDWRRAREDAGVALARPNWGDAVWSFLYKQDTDYARVAPAPGQVAAAARAQRGGENARTEIHGPFIHAPVWTWEIPLYFWLGGVASGAAFAGLAADLAGDHRAAVTCRRVSLGAVTPAPLLLIADLGRPERFLNMLRIFKPRSPMNLGAWCLMAFSGTTALSVLGDTLSLRVLSGVLGGGSAILGGYLGSYTGVLLATTAVPLWSRSRLVLGPLFVATATATGAAACRLTLAAGGRRSGDPTQRALGRIQAAAMMVELTVSALNERRLGEAGEAFGSGGPGRLFTSAKWLVRAGLALQLGTRRGRFAAPAQHLASLCFLTGGLAFRFAWVEAGKVSAREDDVVARAGRSRRGPRMTSRQRTPVLGGRPSRAGRTYTEAVRRASLLVEGVIRRRIKSR